jgi:spore coat protein CotF
MKRPPAKKRNTLAEWMKQMSESIDNLAAAVNRLAAAQEPVTITQTKSKLTSWGTASYDQTDPQTKGLRAIQVERERIGNSRAR